MKNKKYFLVPIAVILLILVVYMNNYNSINKKISRDLKIHIPNHLEFIYEDNHGGFHGDGVSLAKSQLSNEDVSTIISRSKTNWNKAPIDFEKQLLIYGSKSDGITTSPNIYDQSRLPEIKNGYWIFKDRRLQATKERFPDDRIGNYSLGVIDLDTKIFHYIKFDS